MVRVQLPVHLRALASIPPGELQVPVDAPVTIHAVVGAIEEKYPMLKGTMRDHGTLKRRPMIRFYACQEDWSHEDQSKELPERIASGAEVFYIIAAIAGG